MPCESFQLICRHCTSPTFPTVDWSDTILLPNRPSRAFRVAHRTTPTQEVQALARPLQKLSRSVVNHHGEHPSRDFLNQFCERPPRSSQLFLMQRTQVTEPRLLRPPVTKRVKRSPKTSPVASTHLRFHACFVTRAIIMVFQQSEE